MAGNIENADILNAFNQSVKAINDLATAVAGLVLGVTVEPPVVNVSSTCTCNCSCAGGAGSSLPAENGDEGQTPPPGYVAPDPETTDRKCKVANLVFDSLAALVSKLAVLDVDQYVALGFTLTLAAVGAAVGSLLPGPGTLIGGVAGVLVAIASQLLTGGALLDLSDLGVILSSNHETLVNDLYNATTAEDAHDRVIATITTAGATLIEQQIISSALTTNLLNLLFFTIPEYEPDIAAYVGEIDCATAVVTGWHFDAGAEGWILGYAYGSEFEQSHGWDYQTPGPDPNDPSAGFMKVVANKTSAEIGCEPSWHRDVSEMGIVAHTGDSFVFDGWYTTADHSGGSVTITYDDDTTDSQAYPNFSGATWTPLSVTVTAGNNGKTVKTLTMGLGTGLITGLFTYAWDNARWVEV